MSFFDRFKWNGGRAVQSERRHKLRLAGHDVHLPRSRTLRVILGGGLVLGGVFSFLPVLGLWMLPLGAMVLSVDLPPVRRLRRRTEVWWGRSGTGGRVKAGWGRLERRARMLWRRRR